MYIVHSYKLYIIIKTYIINLLNINLYKLKSFILKIRNFGFREKDLSANCECLYKRCCGVAFFLSADCSDNCMVSSRNKFKTRITMVRYYFANVYHLYNKKRKTWHMIKCHPKQILYRQMVFKVTIVLDVFQFLTAKPNDTVTLVPEKIINDRRMTCRRSR